MLTRFLQQTACSLALLAGAATAGAANLEVRTVAQLDHTTVMAYSGNQSLRLATSEGELFSIVTQPRRERVLVNINGVRQAYPIKLLERGGIAFSAEYRSEYRRLWESEVGDVLGIPEDPEVLFSISFWEAAGCVAAGGVIGAATAGWGGGLVGAACLTYFDDHSIETD